jgi:hypothetical protein
MSAYICTRTHVDNGMFREGRTYQVIEHGYRGLTVTLADDRGFARTISTDTKRFCVRNAGEWLSTAQYAFFQPAPTL